MLQEDFAPYDFSTGFEPQYEFGGEPAGRRGERVYGEFASGKLCEETEKLKGKGRIPKVSVLFDTIFARLYKFSDRFDKHYVRTAGRHYRLYTVLRRCHIPVQAREAGLKTRVDGLLQF